MPVPVPSDEGSDTAPDRMSVQVDRPSESPRGRGAV